MKTGIKDLKQSTFAFLANNIRTRAKTDVYSSKTCTDVHRDLSKINSAVWKTCTTIYVTSNSIPWESFAHSQWDVLDLARTQDYIDCCMPSLPPQFEKLYLHVDTGPFSKQVKNCCFSRFLLLVIIYYSRETFWLTHWVFHPVLHANSHSLFQSTHFTYLRLLSSCLLN